MSYEFIFVHGTWASTNEFGQLTSKLVMAMMEFAGSGSTFQRFTWSGRNTVTAREEASTQFAELILSLPPKDSGTRRVVVSHSHGGSVVMMSLLRPEMIRAIDAVICIGTPFLHVYRLQEVEPMIPPPLPPLAGLISCIGGILCLWLLLFDSMPRDFIGRGLVALAQLVIEWPITSLLSLLASILFGGLIFIIYVFASIVHAHVSTNTPFFVSDFYGSDIWRGELTEIPEDDVWLMKERCRLPVAESLPTLLLRVPADETYGALILTGSLSFAIIRLYGMILTALRAAELRTKQFSLLGKTFSTTLAIARWTLHRLLSFPVTVISGLILILYGYEMLPLAGRIMVSAESAPPGSWRVTFLRPLDRVEHRVTSGVRYGSDDIPDEEIERIEAELESSWKDASTGIFHARGYNDPRAISLIKEWLNRQSWQTFIGE
jgi:hypothetical protein